MRLFLLRDSCPDRVSCPQVYVTDRGTYVVQGYVVEGSEHSPGETVVEVPLALVPEFAARSHPDWHLTNRDTVVIRGLKVTDPEAFAALRLDVGEDAAELAAGAVPVLAVSQ